MGQYRHTFLLDIMTELGGHRELTRAVKVQRDGRGQFARGFQRGGAGHLSSVRGARARPAIFSLRLGLDGAQDALAGRDDPWEARLTSARARCTVPY